MTAFSDLLPDPDELGYEDHKADDVRARKGRLVYYLAPGRFHAGGQLRQLLGYMLDERDWLTDPIVKVAVADGHVVARLGNSALVLFFGPEPAIRATLDRVCKRAELGAEDAEFLMSMPGVEGATPPE